ncbi:hypothetical protein LPJ81_002765 [Coemansia sp. IMI 209127]|nr:hypothetical protein LPJ81_002765 [Coemansia sp. IMI 209127]
MDTGNRRTWLERAQSSDVVFFNMAFESAAALVAQSTEASSKAVPHAPSDASRASVVSVHVEHRGTTKSSQIRPSVACIACTARKIDVAIGDPYSFCVVEHAEGALSVIRFDGSALVGGQVVWAQTLPGDILRAWWIECGLLGVLRSTGMLMLSVVDVCADNAIAVDHRLADLVAPAAIARGSHIACVVAPPEVGSPWVLRSWAISPTKQQSPHRVVQVVESPACTLPGRVLDVRWIGDEGPVGLGIGAQPEHTFWFATSIGQCSVCPSDMSRSLPPVVPSWRWHAAVVATGASGNAAPTLPPERPVLCLPGPAGSVFYSLDARKGLHVVHKTRFPRGWVWLCGSHSVFVILSPCRRMAALCRMPLGARLVTIHTSVLIQDAWIAASGDVCALSAGDMLYLVHFSCLLKD